MVAGAKALRFGPRTELQEERTSVQLSSLRQGLCCRPHQPAAAMIARTSAAMPGAVATTGALAVNPFGPGNGAA